MEKIDFKKKLKHLYGASAKEMSVVDTPELRYLMLDGKGDPNTSEEYSHGVEALFSLSYTLKFMLKKGKEAINYGVLPLEALWWAEDMSSFTDNDKSNWQWTLLMMQPDFISREHVEQATRQVEEKKNPPALQKIYFETLNEGKCAQIMHIGPFSEEGPTIEKLHQFIAQQGCELQGKHHEIYLSDIRRAAPEKWRTIIRQPFK